MEKLLDAIVEKLYDATGNASYHSELQEFDQEDLQILLKTPSQNKGLIKGIIKSDNRGYGGVKLTELGIQYYEDKVKLDK